jgi:thiol-disulfide isomerase/thioredoxin
LVTGAESLAGTVRQRLVILAEIHGLMKRILGLSLSCLLFSACALRGSDETADFEEFQQLVRTSAPRVISQALNDGHSGAEQRGQFERKVADRALTVMERAAEFDKKYPQSPQFRQVRDGVRQTLAMAFGYIGFPIPTNRVTEVEACTRELLRNDLKDEGLHMVLFRIAQNLPTSLQRTRLEELNRIAISGGVSEKVKIALRNLDRLGLPIELTFTAMDGQTVSPAALKGKVVVVDFWAPSCGPCVRDFPHMKELYSKYKAQGLEVIGISIDPDEKDLKRFLGRQPLPWPVKYDGNESKQRVAQAFGIEEIPVVWLIDRQGVLRDLKGRENQDKKIEALLKEQ